MTKSQRSRLAVLAAQSARTEAEATEFATLSALALTHPDASKDTDLPAAAAPASAPTLKTVLGAALHSLRGNNAVAADLATARATIGTLTTDLATANASVAALTSERDTARASLVTSEAQCAAFAAYFGMDAKAFAGKTGPEVGALINEKISALVLEQAASLGVAAATLPTARSGDVSSATELRAEYTKLLAEDATSAGAFFTANCEKMYPTGKN